MNGKTAKLCRRFAAVTGDPTRYRENAKDVKERYRQLPGPERAGKKEEMRMVVATMERIGRGRK